MIDYRHRESGLSRVGHEWNRVVAGAAYDQCRWRDQNVGEDEMRVERIQSRPGLCQRGRGETRQIAIEIALPGRAGALTWCMHDDRSTQIGRTLHDRRNGEGVRSTEVIEQRARCLECDRLRHRLYEDIDRSVAAQAQTPQRVVIGTRVVVEKLGNAGGDHLLRDFADVRLQAAAAHATQRPAVVFDEELGPRPPIGRAGDVDNGRESGAASERSEMKDAADDLGRFPPMFHERDSDLRTVYRPWN